MKNNPQENPILTPPLEGILLVNKEENKTSFSIIRSLRKRTKIKKIGHCGTLDPFATGLMVILIGRNFTKKSETYLSSDKEYLATLFLGATSTTFDREGSILFTSDKIPTLKEIQSALSSFQGKITQIPPPHLGRDSRLMVANKMTFLPGP